MVPGPAFLANEFDILFESTKNFLAPLRSAVESIVPADSAHYWILLVTLLVCPALILYGHHVETRANKIPNKPTSLRKSMKAAETEMKAKKNE